MTIGRRHQAAEEAHMAARLFTLEKRVVSAGDPNDVFSVEDSVDEKVSESKFVPLRQILVRMKMRSIAALVQT